MLIDLYGNGASAPCRSVLLTAKALGVGLNLIQTMPMSPDVAKPDFIKMNPQKTIPTMNDNGLYLNESRAMMQYLCNKYAKNDKFYSKVPNERAIVDCRLNFDMGTLYSRFAETYYPVIFFGQPKFAEDKVKRLDDALDFVESYLEQGYIAGGTLSIADIAVVVTLSTMEAFGHNFANFNKLKDYLARCKKEIPGYEEINQKGLDFFMGLAGPALEKAREN